MTVHEVAKNYNVCDETVRRWIRTGKLKATFISRKQGYLIEPDEIALSSAKKADPYIKTLSDRLKSLRRASNLSADDLAKIVGVCKTLYVRYESGYQDIPGRMIAKLSNYYGVSADYILGL